MQTNKSRRESVGSVLHDAVSRKCDGKCPKTFVGLNAPGTDIVTGEHSMRDDAPVYTFAIGSGRQMREHWIRLLLEMADSTLPFLKNHSGHGSVARISELDRLADQFALNALDETVAVWSYHHCVTDHAMLKATGTSVRPRVRQRPITYEYFEPGILRNHLTGTSLTVCMSAIPWLVPEGWNNEKLRFVKTERYEDCALDRTITPVYRERLGVTTRSFREDVVESNLSYPNFEGFAYPLFRDHNTGILIPSKSGPPSASCKPVDAAGLLDFGLIKIVRLFNNFAGLLDFEELLFAIEREQGRVAFVQICGGPAAIYDGDPLASDDVNQWIRENR